MVGDADELRRRWGMAAGRRAIADEMTRRNIDTKLKAIPQDELEAALSEALDGGVLTTRTMRATARSAGPEVAYRIELALEEYAP
jgi:hypothetical protein